MSEIDLLKSEIKTLRLAVARKEAIERAMEEIAIQFIMPSNQEHAIEFALEKALALSGADRAVIMQVNPDNPSLISFTHEKCRKGIRAVLKYAQNIPHFNNKWFQKIHEEQGYVSVTDTANMPSEAGNEKKIFVKNGICAILMASFASNNEFRGNLHLDFNKPIKEWPPDIIRLVLFVALLIEHSLNRKNSEMKLLREKERAEESDKMKSSFMSNLSHEIRTPLNGILGFSKLMLSDRFDENKKKQYLSKVETSSKQLLSVIDDLIDLSRIESGSIKIIQMPVDLKELLVQIYDSFLQEIPDQKMVHLDLDLPFNNKTVELKTDPQRLKQIIFNLLKNALQYTTSGSISLGYRLRGKKVQIQVSDTGIGIEKEDLPKVFNRFWQVDHDKARNYGGSALGLSISKDFAQMLGGDIMVKSKPGKGSTFTLVLPL
jgi:signal transduction histidine kinase